MNEPEPLTCALFLFVSFVSAGIAQTIWFTTRYSHRWKQPLDGHGHFRGRRIFGDNKTLSGFVVMVPATGLTFLITSSVLLLFSTDRYGLWNLSATEYALLGVWAGFWFMVGELPNSFFKRQFGIAPGQPAAAGWQRSLCFVLDQIDSVLAALLAIALIVPVPIIVWFLVLGLGGVVHWLFNVVLVVVGVKTRAA